MHNLELTSLGLATWQTLYMVFISGVLSLFLGLALGIFLFVTDNGQALQNKTVNRILGFIVNATRSLPFIILLITIIPLTQIIAGTSIGTNAAIVPLTVAAIPFFARICEAAFSEVSLGLVEAGHALGATTWQLISKIVIPESLPALIKGATLTIIGLIGYSAMAGTVGGGGLGELAINYGYERFDALVMVETVIVLIIIVQIVQHLGDYLAKVCRLKWLGISAIIFALICIGTQCWPTAFHPQKTVKVGVMSGNSVDLMKVVQRVAYKRYGLHIQIVPFDDYVQPNVALDNGSIDANVFQHVPYLNAQVKAHGYHIVAVAKTFVYPFGFYSKKLKHLSQLPDGAVIGIPNDPSNEGRALLLLARTHLIKLRAGIGLFPTPRDIENNPEHLKFITLSAAQIPRSLDNLTLGGLTNDYAKPAGFTPSQAVLLEGGDSPYANIVAVRVNHKNYKLIKELIAAIHSKAYLDANLKAFPNGAAIAAFSVRK